MSLILVVEDEQIVMDMTTELLYTLGHRVLQAATGEAALRILSSHNKGEIDLVLLDLSLPDWNGLELLPELRKGHVDEKIIVCSGDTTAKTEIKDLSPPVAFLGKPFTLGDLALALDQSMSCS